MKRARRDAAEMQKTGFDIATRHSCHGSEFGERLDPVNDAEDRTARHPIRVGAMRAPLSAVRVAAAPAQRSHPGGSSQPTQCWPPQSGDLRRRLTSRAVCNPPGVRFSGGWYYLLIGKRWVKSTKKGAAGAPPI